MRELILSPAALSDLQSISLHTLEIWGPEQEIRYLEAIWHRLEEIRAKPEAYRLRTDLLESCHSARCGRHTIFFTTGGNAVEVIRILHGAMDFPSHVPIEEP